MYSITKTYDFEAAHQLLNHEGKCSRIHGHSYKVDVTIESEYLREEDPDASDYAMVMDFGDLDEIMKPLVNEIDHHFIVPAAQDSHYQNTILDSRIVLPIRRSTAEELSTYFLVQIEKVLRPMDAIEVTVWETAKSRATTRVKYRP